MDWLQKHEISCACWNKYLFEEVVSQLAYLILFISLQNGLSEFDTLFFLLKLLFEELLERAKEKEEKEAKKRQRLADDFTNLLYTLKVDEDSTMIWFIFHSFWLNGSL